MQALAFEKEFTAVYRAHQAAHPAAREAKCLRVIYPQLLPPIEASDAFAGRALIMEWKGVGFSPDVTLFNLPHGMGYFYRASVFEDAMKASPEDADEIRNMMAFWEKENTTAHVKRAFTDRIRQALPSDSFAGDVGIGFPLYRMTGSYENYETLLSLGLDGLVLQIEQSAGTDKEFLNALADTTRLIGECALVYAAQAKALGKSLLARDLTYIAHHKPETLQQAIQLMWLYSCMAGVMDYGRMDVYLGDYLQNDLANGTLTESEAQEMICGLWRMLVARKTVYHGRVVLGGVGRRNVENADKFALMAMEASRIVHDIEPQLTLRLYEGMNPALYEKALDVIGSGATYPMLYNDDVNVPSVANAFRVDPETAKQYVPFGCGEYIIDHKGFGSPNGVINMLKALEATLFDGQELVKNQPMGLKLGSLTDFDTFEDFYAAYKRQVSHAVEVLAEAEKIILDKTHEQAPFLMMSLLYDGCIEKGLSYLGGGIDYLGATLESYGNINTVDSLQAIKEAVFNKKLIAKATLLDALKSDFAGYEKEREILLACKKYGNDDAEVDGLARDLHDFEARLIRNQAQRVGLHSFLMVVINNSANTYLGRWTGASADGRKALTFMANANNPVSGMDQKGVTAMLNSLLHFPPENHAGAVQNIKFDKQLFEKARDKISTLLKQYFKKGGTQAMITVIGRGELEDALIHPERHRNLLVRVGGFSARFVELEKDVQQEVLTRTMH